MKVVACVPQLWSLLRSVWSLLLGKVMVTRAVPDPLRCYHSKTWQQGMAEETSLLQYGIYLSSSSFVLKPTSVDCELP